MSGEHELWCSVVRLAISDAKAGDETAYKWFDCGDRDFRLVCDLAGFDAEAVRGRVLAMLPPREQPVPSAEVATLLKRLATLKAVKVAACAMQVTM